MKLSRVGLMFVVVVIFSFGWKVKPSEAFADTCRRPDILFSYLDIDRYNKSYPYVDYMAIVNPVLNHMLGHNTHVIDSYADLAMYWVQICRAEDAESEIAAWKNLAYDLNHRMFTDESVYKIVKQLFGDELVGQVMNPPNAHLHSRLNIQEASYLECADRVTDIFIKHCGMVGSFYSMKYISMFQAICGLGVDEKAFELAASETCKGNVYVLHPPGEKAGFDFVL